MIRIVTLFLGLIVGPQSVDFQVWEPVAVVEVVLDGEVVGRLDGPPWRLTVDFGDSLVPHRLVAVGRDRRGAEVGRAERRVNLGDGVTVPGRDESFVTDAGITAVAVSLDAGTRLPPPSEIGSWFLVDGEPAAVLSVEKGPAEVIFVRDPRARQSVDDVVSDWLSRGLELAEVPEAVFSSLTSGRGAFFDVAGEVLPITDPLARRRRLAGLWEQWSSLARLGDDTAFRFISPYAAPVSHVATRKEVFNTVTRPVSVGDGFLFQAVRVRPRIGYLRIGDAVAVAGVEAFTARKRRAVVLLLTYPQVDDSRYRPDQVRDYLRALRVPLFVWSVDPADQRRRDRSEADDPPVDWGAARVVVDRQGATVEEYMARLRDAFREVGQSLAAQRVVWLRGAHLPQQVSLAPGVTGIRFAGVTTAGTSPDVAEGAPR
ncbi:MAG: hypothetical protein V3T72_15685 [Thermoanaerobaculia bacterium]